VWIDFLGSSPSRAGVELRRMIVGAEPFALAGVVVTEVLQDLKRDVSRVVGASIAAIALELGATLFTLDKDSTRIGGLVHLPLYIY
jgi:hypothetical protein